jgi:hypothetical protein
VVFPENLHFLSSLLIAGRDLSGVAPVQGTGTALTPTFRCCCAAVTVLCGSALQVGHRPASPQQRREKEIDAC